MEEQLVAVPASRCCKGLTLTPEWVLACYRPALDSIGLHQVHHGHKDMPL